MNTSKKWLEHNRRKMYTYLDFEGFFLALLRVHRSLPSQQSHFVSRIRMFEFIYLLFCTGVLYLLTVREINNKLKCDVLAIPRRQLKHMISLFSWLLLY